MKISTHIKDGKTTLTRGTANEKDVAQKRHASSYPSSSASSSVSSPLSSYPSSSASVGVSSPLSSPPSSSASVGVSSPLSSPPSSSASVGVSPQERSPLFSTGYNDRPLTAPGQLQGWISYLRDNPLRLWLKHHYPDRLRNVYNFTIGDSQTRYTAVGNTFLLKYPERQQVRCHRNLTEEQIHNEVNHYLHIARTGVVLVSPFISPAEKAVYEACYKEQLPMVRLVKRALDGKFVYPQGRDFDACAQGFLVVLAPFATGSENAADLRISRTQCLTLNDCAAELASSASRRISDEYNGYVPQQISP